MVKKPPAPSASDVEITVLVTAHNEAERIEPCLRAIMDQDYPIERIEILLVDDRSTDGTAERARELGLSCLRLLRLEAPPPGLTSRQGALDLGLREARGEIVLVTDAGGRVPREWIRDLTGHLGFRDGAATGPVIFGGRSVLARFQTIDALLGLTFHRWANRHVFASGLFGANMAIRREAYLETGGFPAIGFALAEDLALGQAIGQGGWSLRYLAAPATLKPAEATVGGYLERARRRALNTPPAVAWIRRLMILSNLALLLLALLTASKIWLALLVIRYLAGLVAIGLTVGQYVASDLVPWIFIYEPVMLLTEIYVALSNLIAHRWSWGGIQYSRPK